jgi:hypothetical protein
MTPRSILRPVTSAQSTVSLRRNNVAETYLLVQRTIVVQISRVFSKNIKQSNRLHLICFSSQQKKSKPFLESETQFQLRATASNTKDLGRCKVWKRSAQIFSGVKTSIGTAMDGSKLSGPWVLALVMAKMASRAMAFTGFEIMNFNTPSVRADRVMSVIW